MKRIRSDAEEENWADSEPNCRASAFRTNGGRLCGRVGLKGSDGRDIYEKALKLGATPNSPRRAIEALKRIVPLADLMELVTYSAEMGENEAKECGLRPTVIGSIESGKTVSADTKDAAREMEKITVQLILAHQ